VRIEAHFAHTMPAMTQTTAKILLNPDVTVTCPHCEREFALAEGFAKKALETVEHASERALAALREDERVSGRLRKLPTSVTLRTRRRWPRFAR
jgi:hypothetical protein